MMMLMSDGAILSGDLTVEEQIAAVRSEQAALERRVAVIEAMLAAIRAEETDQQGEPRQ